MLPACPASRCSFVNLRVCHNCLLLFNQQYVDYRFSSDRFSRLDEKMRFGSFSSLILLWKSLRCRVLKLPGKPGKIGEKSKWGKKSWIWIKILVKMNIKRNQGSCRTWKICGSLGKSKIRQKLKEKSGDFARGQGIWIKFSINNEVKERLKHRQKCRSFVRCLFYKRSEKTAKWVGENLEKVREIGEWIFCVNPEKGWNVKWDVSVSIFFYKDQGKLGNVFREKI